MKDRGAMSHPHPPPSCAEHPFPRPYLVNSSHITRMKPSFIVNGFQGLLFVVQVSHEDVTTTEEYLELSAGLGGGGGGEVQTIIYGHIADVSQTNFWWSIKYLDKSVQVSLTQAKIPASSSLEVTTRSPLVGTNGLTEVTFGWQLRLPLVGYSGLTEAAIGRQQWIN